jgi:hypothetical protein
MIQWIKLWMDTDQTSLFEEGFKRVTAKAEEDHSVARRFIDRENRILPARSCGHGTSPQDR